MALYSLSQQSATLYAEGNGGATNLAGHAAAAKEGLNVADAVLPVLAAAAFLTDTSFWGRWTEP